MKKKVVNMPVLPKQVPVTKSNIKPKEGILKALAGAFRRKFAAK